MRSTLYIKFILVYIVFGFLSIFTVASLTPELMLNQMEQQVASALYRESALLSSDYLPQYFSGDLTVTDIRYQLAGLQDYTDANIWFVEKDGTLIADLKEDALKNILIKNIVTKRFGDDNLTKQVKLKKIKTTDIKNDKNKNEKVGNK